MQEDNSENISASSDKRILANKELGSVFEPSTSNISVSTEGINATDISTPTELGAQESTPSNVNNINVNINVSQEAKAPGLLQSNSTKQNIQNSFSEIVNNITNNPKETEDLKKSLEIQSPEQNINISNTFNESTTEVLNRPSPEQSKLSRTNLGIISNIETTENSFTQVTERPVIQEQMSPRIFSVISNQQETILSQIQQGDINQIDKAYYNQTNTEQPIKVVVNKENDLSLTSEALSKYRVNMDSFSYEKDTGLLSAIKNMTKMSEPESEELSEAIQDITNRMDTGSTINTEYKQSYQKLISEVPSSNLLVNKMNSPPLWRTVLG